MLAFLALLVAFSTVSGHYGSGPSNDQPSSYSSNNVYYPPAVYDSHYWDYDSRERHYKQCPKLTTFVGELPGIPQEAFYPPVIRYVKYGKKFQALVSCDRDPKNFNLLLARRTSSRDVRKTDLVAAGTTAGITLKCDRDERRFEGTVVDLTDALGGDFSKQEEVTQLTCMGLRETFIGLVSEVELKSLANQVFAYMMTQGYLGTPLGGGRKKIEVSDAPAASTESPVVETTAKATAAAAESTGAVAATTKATIDNGAADVVAATTAAPESAAKKLGDLLGKLFKP